MQTHADIVEAFGGQTQIARILGLPVRRTSHWKERGIPLKYWFKLQETEQARERGITALMLASLAINATGERS